MKFKKFLSLAFGILTSITATSIFNTPKATLTQVSPTTFLQQESQSTQVTCEALNALDDPNILSEIERLARRPLNVAWKPTGNPYKDCVDYFKHNIQHRLGTVLPTDVVSKLKIVSVPKPSASGKLRRALVVAARGENLETIVGSPRFSPAVAQTRTPTSEWGRKTCLKLLLISHLIPQIIDSGNCYILS